MADIDHKPSNELMDEKEQAAEFAGEKLGLSTVEILEAADHITLEQAREIIRASIANKQNDPNFDQALLKRSQAALQQDSLSHDHANALVQEIKLEAALYDDSPYVEVRTAVSNTDDPNMYVNTFRAWFIGLVMVVIGSGLNVFFAARQPAITLSSQCAQVLAYPIAKAMEYLPTRAITIRGRKYSLNPGPFNVKEHMLITIMANVTFGGAVGVYSTDIVVVERLALYFGENEYASQAGLQILLTLSTQLIGFSLAGMSRRFLVYPASMIWPTNLATIVLNRAFHNTPNEPANGWQISRLKFFFIVFVVYGIYFMLPSAVFGALGTFNWITWISPTNVSLALWTGSVSGLGINPWPTFDWSVASLLFSPLITPLYAAYNTVGGMALIGLTMIPAIFYTNTYYTQYLPINSNHIYDNTASRYNISAILNPDFTVNVAAYHAYSPVYQSAANAVVFFSFFAAYTATIVHVGLYYRREIVDGFKSVFQRKSARDSYNDVHNRLMRAYPEVPETWFIAVLVVSLIFGIVANEYYHTTMPVWGIFFGVGLGALFIVPIGIITAVSTVEITLNVVAEVIGGYALPGRPLGLMIFKTYGFIAVAQALGYVSDMKLGHYVKIPPRSLFWAQLVSSVIACFVGLGVVNWQIDNIANFCTPNQVDNFSCPGYSTFFTSAVQGAIGPAELYSVGKIYNALMYGFLVGAIAPVIVYLFTRRYPNSLWKYVSTPIIFAGALNWSPYNLSYAVPALYLAVIFQGYIRSYYLPWWAKYNYLTASALTSAISLFGVVWFFIFSYTNYAPVWWGNTVMYEGCDGSACPVKVLGPDEAYFGPAPY